MKTLFFFYLLSLGVFGYYGSRTTGGYLFNATKLNTTTVILGGGGAGGFYVSLGFEIWETYQNYNQSDGYRSSINMTSPPLPTITAIPSSGKRGFYTAIPRFEPCGMLELFNFSIDLEIEHFPSDLMVKGKLECIAEQTLIRYLPYKEKILDFDLIQYTSYYYGEDHRYRTIDFQYPEAYENKDLVIQLSVLADDARSISSLVKEVIFASGDQCIWTYNISSEDRFVKQIPQDENIRSWNITVPAKDVWYIDIVTVSNRNDFQVDYLLVDHISSSYIPCLDFNLIVVLILSVLIFQK
jgi:hypothetical protein